MLVRKKVHWVLSPFAHPDPLLTCLTAPPLSREADLQGLPHLPSGGAGPQGGTGGGAGALGEQSGVSHAAPSPPGAHCSPRGYSSRQVASFFSRLQA